MTESNLRKTDMSDAWGPGYGPWMYTVMTDPQLTQELARMASATSFGETTDAVTFQPCLNPEVSSQDRYVVQEWAMQGGTWKFLAIFDGHAGHETADYVAETLPGMIHSALGSHLANSNARPPPSSIASILSSQITAFDDSIAQDIIDIFPGGVDALSSLSDDQIRLIINDNGPNSEKVVRGMRGSTVLVALIDPGKENLWVASLGDCQAVLGSKYSDSPSWEARILSANHNGTEREESQRIRQEHPGEEDCMAGNRVLGAIAVTRAVGDHLFKLPALYTTRVFNNSSVPFRVSTKLEDLFDKILTPPYLSNRPQVNWVKLRRPEVDSEHASVGDIDDAMQPHSRTASPEISITIEEAPDENRETEDEREYILIMCSDGLMDLYGDGDGERAVEALAGIWVKAVGEGTRNLENGNLALQLLRHALGGPNEEKVSRMLNLQMFERWMDDTTIIVEKI